MLLLALKMPILIVRRKGKELGRVPLRANPVLIGRLRPADITIDDPLVSGAHAKIFTSDGRYVIRDLSSRNGTYLNGARVTEGILKIGDQLQVGNAVIAVL